ncbi:MAG: pectin esterase [Bacteroidetes bacterium]|nr:pectin esterase [Bacteroidota bacterium]
MKRISPNVIFVFLLLIPFLGNAQYATKIHVAQDGSGDFSSIQDAIDATKSFPDKPITIFIAPGTYREKVKVHAWNTNLTLFGESPENTHIVWDDYFDKIDRDRNSTFFTWTMLVEGNNFRAENLTIENAAGRVGQAIALSVTADRAVFKNCRLLGNQDTLYLSGHNSRQYFEDCYIEGTTDFIFGRATAWFENCTIHSKEASFITAASTTKGKKYGFVFRHCSLSANAGVGPTYLGRPWRSYAQTIFLECKMGGHIRPEGWDNWSGTENESTVYYAEYKSAGPGAAPQSRVSWSHQLKPRKAKMITPQKVLGTCPDKEKKQPDWWARQ